jgi:hypothetical protein
VRFEYLKARKLFLDHCQQPGVLGSEFFAELNGRAGHLWVIVSLNGAVKMIRDSALQGAGNELPGTLNSEPLLPGHDHQGHARQCQRPSSGVESPEKPRLRAPQTLVNGFPQALRR